METLVELREPVPDRGEQRGRRSATMMCTLVVGAAVVACGAVPVGAARVRCQVPGAVVRRAVVRSAVRRAVVHRAVRSAVVVRGVGGGGTGERHRSRTQRQHEPEGRQTPAHRRTQYTHSDIRSAVPETFCPD